MRHCGWLILLSLSPSCSLVATRNAAFFRAKPCLPKERSNTMRMFLPASKETETSSPQQQVVQDTTMIGTLRVPSVGIGTISWSSDSLTSLENLELQSLVDVATSHAPAFFDTAERYGSNLKTAFGMGWGETEMLTRQLLSSSPDHAAVVATKFTPTPWRTTAQSVVDACEESCKRLGVSQIDLYQLHMPDVVQPFRFAGMGMSKDEVYWEGLAECYHRGLVANVGVCNYGPTLLFRCQEALAKRGVPLASNQIAYSLLGRHNGAQSTLDRCNEAGIRVLAFFPFAMGLLTGKYNFSNHLSASKKTLLEEMDLQRDARGIGPLIRVMERIASERRKTIAQVALNYIVCKGAIPIPGARTQAQVRDNMGAMGWRLTPTEVALLERASDELGFGFEGAGFKRTSEKFVGYGVEKWTLD